MDQTCNKPIPWLGIRMSELHDLSTMLSEFIYDPNRVWSYYIIFFDNNKLNFKVWQEIVPSQVEFLSQE